MPAPSKRIRVALHVTESESIYPFLATFTQRELRSLLKSALTLYANAIRYTAEDIEMPRNSDKPRQFKQRKTAAGAGSEKRVPKKRTPIPSQEELKSVDLTFSMADLTA